MKISRTIGCFGFLFTTAFCRAAEISVTYDPQSGVFDSDAVSLSRTSAGGRLLAVSAADGDTVVVDGGTFSVDGDLAVCLSNNVRLVFLSGVSVAGDLAISSPKAGLISYLAPTEGDGRFGFSTAADTLAFAGVRLADYELHSSDFSDRGNGISGLAKPGHFFSDEGTSQTIQFQRKDDVFTKCVKVTVFQDENGIFARKIYGKYITGDSFGEDFDDLPGVTRYDSYRMTQLTMKLKVSERIRSVRFGGSLSVGGDISVGNGVYTVCGRIEGLLDENGVFDKDVSVDVGAFVFDSPDRSFTLCGRFSGTESTVGVAFPDEADGPTEDCTYVYRDTMNNDDGYVLVQPNASLADVVSVQAYGSGSTLYPLKKYKGVPLDACFVSNDGVRLTCEFQLLAGNGAHFKGMGVCLKQIEGDIYAKIQYAGYIKTADYPDVVEPGDWHFATQGFPGGGGGPSFARPGMYSVSNLTLHARRPVDGYRPVTVALQMTNTMEDSCLLLKGSSLSRLTTKVTALTASPFPESGTVKVGADAYLTLAVAGVPSYSTGYFNSATKVEIARGGYADQLLDYQFGCLSKVAVSGGTMAFRPTRGDGDTGMWLADWSDASTYVGAIEYSNGGKTTYASPRIGLNNQYPSVTVTGNQPCRAEHGFAVVASYKTTFTFDIDDVTGTPATDFTVTGVIRPFSPSHTNLRLVKTGPGTLTFTGANTYTDHPTRVEAGTLRLGASGVMRPEMDLSLEGGSFAVAAGTVNALGTLAVAADATLTVEPDAELAFADSSAETWGADPFTVTVVKDKSAKLRFGTSAAGLLPGQLKSFRLDGSRCRLDPDGYLVPYAGLVLVVR